MAQTLQDMAILASLCEAPLRETQWVQHPLQLSKRLRCQEQQQVAGQPAAHQSTIQMTCLIDAVAARASLQPARGGVPTEPQRKTWAPKKALLTVAQKGHGDNDQDYVLSAPT